MNLRIIKNRYKFFIFSGVLVLASVLSLAFWGLNFSIDFTGGSLLEIEMSSEYGLSAQQVSDLIKQKMPEISEVRVQPTKKGFLIRMKELTENEHQNILMILEQGDKSETVEDGTGSLALSAGQNFDSPDITLQNAGPTGVAYGDIRINEKRFESVGPVIGKELKNKALWAIGLAVIAMIIYIAWAFRKVSKPVASWKYGIGAVIALIHDVLIVIGIFSVLGHFFISFEVDILFITALLTILGYSVNDTIVVYDRTRENLIYNPQTTFEATVEKSVNETIIRSINTGLATLLVLLVLYLFGGETIKNFILTLFLGIIFGTYSSIFIASPFLVVWQKLKKN